MGELCQGWGKEVIQTSLLQHTELSGWCFHFWVIASCLDLLRSIVALSKTPDKAISRLPRLLSETDFFCLPFIAKKEKESPGHQ